MTSAPRGSIAAMTVEQDLPAGTKFWLAAWSKEIAGAPWISISAEVAVGGPRKKPNITERTS